MEKKRFTPETLKKMCYLSALDVSPDYRKAVFVKSIADEHSGEFNSAVYELDLSSGKERLISPPGVPAKTAAVLS